MTEELVDRAIDSAINTMTARSDLKHALVLFIKTAEEARELMQRAIDEHAEGVAPEDVRTTDRVLKTELMWAKHLRGLILDHDFGDVRS